MRLVLTSGDETSGIFIELLAEVHREALYSVRSLLQNFHNETERVANRWL
jgi:hypothetical protein